MREESEIGASVDSGPATIGEEPLPESAETAFDDLLTSRLAELRSELADAESSGNEAEIAEISGRIARLERRADEARRALAAEPAP